MSAVSHWISKSPCVKCEIKREAKRDKRVAREIKDCKHNCGRWLSCEHCPPLKMDYGALEHISQDRYSHLYQNQSFFANDGIPVESIRRFIGDSCVFVFKEKCRFYLRDYKHTCLIDDSSHDHKKFQGVGIFRVTDVNGITFYFVIDTNMSGYCSTCDGGLELDTKVIYGTDLKSVMEFALDERQLDKIFRSIEFVVSE